MPLDLWVMGPVEGAGEVNFLPFPVLPMIEVVGGKVLAESMVGRGEEEEVL